ncbi:P-loop containing nucleoside triphosphate hydrolase protein [Zopfochytrium polystomum]|nr:P-loop containing nucleoside triphosphate hydrolase protein [Zopfochytrium polystomum]
MADILDDFAGGDTTTSNGDNHELIVLDGRGRNSTVVDLVVEESGEAAATANSRKDGVVAINMPASPSPDPSSTIIKSSEKDVQDKADVAPPKIPYRRLFRYARTFDYVLMVFGVFFAMVVGVSQPLMSIVFGQIMDALVTYPFSSSPTRDDDLRSASARGVIYLAIIGVVVTGSATGMMSFWDWASERQAKRIREEYLAAILRQDVAWFDRTPTGELTTRMTADVTTVQAGISHKAALVVQGLTTFLSGFVIGFVKGPKLAGVLCCAFPLLGGASMLMAKSLKNRTNSGSDFYAAAGAIAQEVLSSIRTVTAFQGQKREAARYSEQLEKAEREGIRISLITGSSMGVVFLIIFSTYALGFWYGGSLVGHGMTAGDVLNVFFAIIIGAFSLGQVGPNISAIGSAMGAAVKIFETIDRVSPIDPTNESGLKPDTTQGIIEFHNVDFHYPQRPDVQILKNFSLRIMPGQTVALVGASGSGKSTIVKLIERFYDPVSGFITLDGHDLRTLNVTWLRQQIGVVGQEPVLFDKTVRENLLYGLRENEPVLGDAGPELQRHLSQKVEDACRVANAWEFVSNLPNGINTSVGESGGMMSGGQKQRIAIARAIMRDPSILLLDEATSALDTQSERVVQKALDNASQNRTTVVVAHRLSTIKNADLIVVMSQGKIVEQGTHAQLLSLGGGYSTLVNTQALENFQDGELVEIDGVSPISMSSGKQSSLTSKFPRHGSAHSMGSKSAFAGNFDSKANDARGALAKRKEEDRIKKEVEAAISKRPMAWVRLYGMSSPEAWLYVIGLICSGGAGAVFPVFSLVFSSVINVFGRTDETDRMNGVRFWAILFVVLGLGAFVTNFGSISAFGAAGERLTRRLRQRTFEALLRQEIAFFDDDKHSTGVLASRLAEDANLVQGLVGRNMSSLTQTAVTLVCGLVIAFVNGPILTLIVLCCVPFIALAGAMQLKVMTGYGSKSKEAYEDASVIANEAIDTIRTVLTLTKEPVFLENYKRNIEEPFRIAARGAPVAAIGFGVSQGFIFLTYALAFYAGSQLVLAGKMRTDDVFTVMFAVIFTAISAGQAFSFAPNYVQAKLGTFNIFDILDRHSAIDPSTADGITKESIEGRADLDEAVFNYPSRPSVQVLHGLNVCARPGQTVALVGPSGCGKSTVIALAERWYDVNGGSVSLDGLNVKEWNTESMRSHLALVGQEPVLFNMSIRDNIMYGAKYGAASQEEIEEAARRANIHSFVSSLPEGYNTLVGSKGGQLSGGQKQRVAIARAIIRNPKILLLDEATSALDSESEKVVQEALDMASKGRTTIVIAHRLSTIQNADHIMVVQAGRVIEQGTFSELVLRGGEFAQLVAAQSLGKNS